MHEDVEFVRYILESLVEHQNDISIQRTVDEMGVLISATVHPDDMGKVIGRGGATVHAIRILLHSIGFRSNARINLKLNDPVISV